MTWQSMAWRGLVCIQGVQEPGAGSRASLRLPSRSPDMTSCRRAAWRPCQDDVATRAPRHASDMPTSMPIPCRPGAPAQTTAREALWQEGPIMLCADQISTSNIRACPHGRSAIPQWVLPPQCPYYPSTKQRRAQVPQSAAQPAPRHPEGRSAMEALAAVSFTHPV